MSDDEDDTGFQLLGLPTADGASELRSREPFEVLATQFVDELRRGRRPSVDLYARRYPPHARRIRDCFPVLALLEQARIEKETASFRRNMPDRFPFQRLGRCDLLCELGRGGMGVVFQARDSSSGHVVAVKLLPWRVSIVPEWQARFHSEARTAARLRHRNIVPVYRFGEEHGYCYYVMQFVNGIGLDRIITRLSETDGFICQDEIRRAEENRPSGFISSTEMPAMQLPASNEAIAAVPETSSSSGGRRRKLNRGAWISFSRIAIQTAQALGHAHAAGILHNDIKPANIMLDADGRAWVTDFGLSQPLGPGQSEISVRLAGTLRYMAPERLMTTDPDVRSDVYSLGMTLFELCTLQPAFQNPDRDRLVKSILSDPLTPPRALVPEIPKSLESIILNCSQRHPDERYPTTDALMADLIRFSNGQTVSRLHRRTFSGFFRSLGRSPRRHRHQSE